MGLKYFPGTNQDWAMSLSRPKSQPLSIQIESWPDSSDASRRWTESSSQNKGPTQHVLTQLRPNAIYQLKINGRIATSLHADKTGRIEFSHKRGYALPQKFELGLVSQ